MRGYGIRQVWPLCVVRAQQDTRRNLCPKDAAYQQPAKTTGHLHATGYNTTSNTFGSGGGLFGVGSASIKITGQSQSHLAGIASPPPKKRKNMIYLLSSFFFATVALVANIISGAVFILPVIATILLSYRAYQYNKNQWPPKYQEWANVGQTIESFLKLIQIK